MSEETQKASNPPVDDKAGKVLVDEAQLKDILARLDAFEKKNAPQVAFAKAKNNRTVRVAFYNEMPVVGFGKNTVRLNDMRQEVLDVELKLLTPKETIQIVKVDFNKFLEEAERKIADVIRVDKEEISKPVRSSATGNQEVVEQAVVDGYRMKGTGIMVPMTVDFEVFTYHVKLEDGMELTLDELAVNV